MKYLEYTSILLFTVFRKVFGLVWIYVALPFRAYANNVVFNYVLENGKYLQRLNERPISKLGNHLFNGESFYGYLIYPYHNTIGGYIKYRNISYIEYFIAYWFIWGWNDCDSNEDTFSWGQVEDLRAEWKWFAKATEKLEKPYYGNSFDLGDYRATKPSFNFWATTAWTWRNTAYNFRYMQWEKHKDDKNLWHIEFSNGWELGWKSDAHKGNPDNYSLVFLGWK